MDISVLSNIASMQAPPPPPPPSSADTSTEDLLSFLDSDSSGELSLGEISSDSGLSSLITDDLFSTADADESGSLSAEELETTRPDGPPPPHGGPPPAQYETTTGTNPEALFASMLATSAETTNLSAAQVAIDQAMSNAQNMYEAMQGMLTSVAA
jgi:hypothetical protein